MNRRDVLSALALISAAGPMKALALDATTEDWTFRHTADSVILLRARGVQAQFESGINRVAKTQVHDLPFTSFGQIKSSLKTLRSAVILGWINDSDFLILNETLRDLNGSLWCYSFHREMEGMDQHHFVTSSRSVGIGAIFAHGLNQTNRGARVSETDPTTGRIHRCPLARGGGLSREGSWSEQLGYHLASIAMNRWEPTRVVPSLPRHAPKRGEVAADGVSFVASI